MIFSFVSFKGGVGRTHTLVHTGLRLAHQVRELKLRVLLIDMDLDAPGFEPYFPEVELGSSGGFEALLAGYRAAEPEKRTQWLDEALRSTEPADDSRPWLVSLDEAPNLTLLPAGSVALSEGRYAQALAALADERTEGQGFFEDLRAALNAHWDYVLLDARAGLAELTFASAITLADALVPCARLNQANLDGIRDMYGTFLARGEGEPWERRGLVVPVLTPVPPRSGADLQGWIEKATRTFFPEWKPDGGNDEPELRLTDVQGMFPLVHRIFEDEAARLGEWRFLSLVGEPDGGADEQTPIFTAIGKVVDHLRALNADSDAGGAKLVEIHLFSKAP
jgi:cellulose biosynthesis protein BcsQ